MLSFTRDDEKEDLFPMKWMRCKLRRKDIYLYLKKRLLHVQSIWNHTKPYSHIPKTHLCGQLFFSTGNFISSVHVSTYNSTKNLQHFIIARNFIKSLFSHLWPYCALFYIPNITEKTSSYYKYQQKKRVLASNVAFMYLLMVSHNVNL